MLDQLTDRVRAAAARRAATADHDRAHQATEDHIRSAWTRLVTAGSDLQRGDTLTGLAHAYTRLGELRPQQAGHRAWQATLLREAADVYHQRHTYGHWPHDPQPVPASVQGLLRETAQAGDMRTHLDRVHRLRAELPADSPIRSVADLVTAAVSGTLRTTAATRPVLGRAVQAFSRLRPTPTTASTGTPACGPAHPCQGRAR
ncbi:hypothetical protein Areg01_74000 [Actinoplanes regularis]|nr:hypothetical protein Areg01_74000 [Actinoplanes regularis]